MLGTLCWESWGAEVGCWGARQLQCLQQSPLEPQLGHTSGMSGSGWPGLIPSLTSALPPSRFLGKHLGFEGWRVWVLLGELGAEQRLSSCNQPQCLN